MKEKHWVRLTIVIKLVMIYNSKTGLNKTKLDLGLKIWLWLTIS